MNIIAIECSQPRASLCLSLAGNVCAQASWHTERNHDAHLFPALEKALSELGDEPLDMVLVGAGPGSYGGVRVALAAAVGIATVKGARVVAIGSWDDLAADGALIISDARRGGWTLRRSSGEIVVLTPDELHAELAGGSTVYTVESEEVMRKHNLSVAKAGLVPSAEGLIRSWKALTPAAQEELAAKPAEPLYVRPPHITAAKHKPWEIRS